MCVYNLNRGFTLVEVMIVVAIIAILTSIALPAYNNYTAKAKYTSAYAEVNLGKVQADLIVHDGKDIADPSEVFTSAASEHCSYTASIIGGAGNLRCIIKGPPAQVAGVVIRFERASDGVWSCFTDAASEIKGALCP